MLDFDTETAYNTLQSEPLTKVLDYANRWIQANPHSLEALQFCGIVQAKANDFKQALYYFKQAEAQYPYEPSCHLNLSNVYVSLGNTELAIRHLYEVLRLNPQHAESYNNLGRLFYKERRIEEAIAHFAKALRINPNFWEAHYNIAHSFALQNQLDRSAAHYREVIRLFPNHPTAHFNLGLLYVENQENELAETHLTQALSLDKSNVEAMRQLGQAYVNLGKMDNALQIWEQALTLAPTLADVHHNLAILYLRNDNSAKALAHFKEALALNPTNDTAKHMVMALTGNQAATAPSEYIVQLFDQYADYYDSHLKLKLKYNAPTLLRNAVGQCLEKNPKASRVLDIGCGTGLCGIVFRDLARELIGIDLSPKMLEKAKFLDAYDKLFVADIQDYLSQPNVEPFDLIIACDVLVYSGDLENLFKKITQALAKGGRFAFTTEYLSQGDYQLQPTGRFAHSPQYLQTLAQQHHLALEYQESIVLREHEGKPIAGQLTILKAVPKVTPIEV